ncbi:hypothetical protein HHI36_004691 [Cryptolaemus montrouzieri]|uniref:Uncharacterized protein n=1 Tax=Cryptolaemus montrouzieri TaxID=559131 RepID=A0ABD2NSD0_9CUCU
MSDNLASLNTFYKDFTNDVAKIKTCQTALVTEMMSCRALLDQHSISLSDHQAQLDSNKSRLDQLVNQHASLTAEVSSFSTDLDSLRDSVSLDHSCGSTHTAEILERVRRANNIMVKSQSGTNPLELNEIAIIVGHIDSAGTNSIVEVIRVGLDSLCL